MDNLNTAKLLLDLAPNASVVEEIREIDLSPLGERFAGIKLQVRVNPPAVLNVMLQDILARDTNPPREEIITALNTLTDISPDILSGWAEPLLYWCFYRAREVYWQYWEELRKKARTP